MGEGNTADVMYEGRESNGLICMKELSNHMLLKVNIMLQIRCSCLLGEELGTKPAVVVYTLERGFPWTTSVVVTRRRIVCRTLSSSTPASISTRRVATMDSTLFCKKQQKNNNNVPFHAVHT